MAASASGIDESPSSCGSPRARSRNGAIFFGSWDAKVCCRSVLKYAVLASWSGDGKAQRWKTG